MTHQPVPVTLGSPEFRHASVKGCGVVHAWFPPNSTIELHTHEHPTFAVMLNGSFDLAFQRRTFSCTPSSIAVEPAGENHANYIGAAGADVLVLQPVPQETELWRPFGSLFDRITFFRHGGIAGLATRLAGEIRSPDALSPLAIEGLLLDMLVAASRIRPDTRRETLPPWLSRIQEMLHEEPAAALSARALARAAGVHPAYLSRAFRRFFHCSLGEYARRVRLEWTAARLISGRQSIAALAMEAGFADQSHFTRCFKRYYHTTPRSFREAHRGPSGPRR
jgi:AraC-like DNA-binding protein/quercetin dioxygenase-like cupin family protein